MKYHVAFLAGLIAILGVFSYLTFSMNENGLLYLHGEREDLAQVLATFQRQHEAKFEVNLSSMYSQPGQIEVLHPILDVRQLKVEHVQQLCSGEFGRKIPASGFRASCRPNIVFENDFAEAGQRKLEVLSHFLYQKGELPRKFLANPPYITDLGDSFAYLLVKNGPSPFNQRAWVEQHLSYFRVTELKELLNSLHITDPAYTMIASLSDSEIETAVRGEPVVLTAKYLLIKDQSNFGFSPLSYQAYDLPVFENAIKDGDYELGPLSGSGYCLQRMGNACWTYNSKYALNYLYRYSVAILVILGMAFIAFITLYLKRLYDKSREEQKHRLSLQVLSHEFRTPVSSMLLMLEELRRHQQNFDLKEQDLLTRVSTEVYRLQRIVEVSKTYLQAEGGSIQFKQIQIASINHWIADFIEEAGLPVECKLLDQDQGFEADPFWLKFILSSLVQNAFAHGAEPVRILLSHQRGQLRITVEDQGKCEYKSLGKMTEAFVKSQRSKGMGLGLNIVKFIVDEWGGEIQYSNQPTSFTLMFSPRRAKGA